MRNEERIAAARDLLNSSLFHLLMDELEGKAIDGCINAKSTDHETRAAFAAEARAIRNLRHKLNLLSGEANAGGVQAPA